MLLLQSTDKIQVVTDAAVTTDVYACFMDVTNANPPVVQGDTSNKQVTAITTAATTDVIAAPAATEIRNVKLLNIRNKHASLSVNVTVQINVSATIYELFKATLAPGAVLNFVEGIGWFVSAPQTLASLMRVENADETGQNVATAQPWFPTSGGVTVTGDTAYFMTGMLAMTRAAGTTSHTTGLLFAGTATLTSIQYHAMVNTGDVDTSIAVNRNVVRVATNTTVKAADIVATEAISVLIHGIVRVNAGGTFIPQFIYSVAPGGAPTIKRDSFFAMEPWGSGSFASQGAWA
jgi:hypothetical protein